MADILDEAIAPTSATLPDIALRAPVGGGAQAGAVTLDELVAGGRERSWVPTTRQLEGATDEPVDEPTGAPTGGLTPPASGPPTSRLRRARRRGRSEAASMLDIGGVPLPIIVLTASVLIGAVSSNVEAVALPEIQASLGVGLAGGAMLLTAVGIASQVLSLPLGFLADRLNRVRLLRITAVFGALGVAASAFAGSAGTYLGLSVGGTALNDLATPVHQPLLTDWYPSSSRGRVFGLLNSAQNVATLIAIPISGFAVDRYGWRPVLFVGGLLALLLFPLYLLLREPVRGGVDRLESGISPADAAIEQTKPSFLVAVRASLRVRTVLVLGFASIALNVGDAPTNVAVANTLAHRFTLSPGERSLYYEAIALIAIPVLLLGGIFADRLLSISPRVVASSFAVFYGIVFLAMIGLGLAPNVWVFVAISGTLATLTGVLGGAQVVVISLALPARYRGTGLQVSVVFGVVGNLIAEKVESSSIHTNPQAIFLIFSPAFLAAGVIALGAIGTITGDIRAARAASTAELDMRRSREAAREKVLVCRDVDVVYGGVQVLFGVDLDVERGEILALVGTNGAGKSTLLRAVCGLQQASNGAVFYDGEEITSAPAHENVARGLVYMPGGQAVFPALTVRENLEAAHTSGAAVDLAPVLAAFPVLGDRLSTPAGALSGGEQQMLALGQVLLMRPSLLLIDELSLGLAPAIVEQLLAIVRKLRDDGMTIVLVEQSLNVAFTVADRAVFLDRGRVQFDGTPDELLARPDLVRAVFLGGAGVVGGGMRRAGRASLDEPEIRLRAEGLSVSYGGHVALDDVTLHVDAGEVVGIIGPNGAGKTTLFDVLSGYVRPDAGAVLLGDEEDVSRLSPDARARRGLGRAFQSARLFPPLTVRENIAVALERRTVKSSLLAALWAPPVRRGERKLRARIDGFIELLGLEPYADRFVSELSTGTRRAVEIACQMAAEPRVLLLDEPSSGLAQAETEALGPTLLRVVRETGCGMVVIEHDLPLITQISDRLLAMELGRVIADGTPDAVVTDPGVLRSYLSASRDVIERSGTRFGSVLSSVAPAADVAAVLADSTEPHQLLQPLDPNAGGTP